MSVRLTVVRGVGAGALRARILRRTKAMMKLLQLEKDELSLVLSDDAQLHELNKLHRNKDRPTDVLAFPMREGEHGETHKTLPVRLLGDVIVSVPTAKAQAREAKRDLLGEITMLVAHGILHLVGWDHDTAAKDKKMRAETDRLVLAAEKADRTAPARAKPRPAQRRQAARS